MVLGETCKMAATWADRRKVATLGAGRGDWCCIGTSLDALGVPGARHRPRPRLSEPRSRVWRGRQLVMAPSACELSQMATQGNRRKAVRREGRREATCRPLVGQAGWVVVTGGYDAARLSGFEEAQLWK